MTIFKSGMLVVPKSDKDEAWVNRYDGRPPIKFPTKITNVIYYGTETLLHFKGCNEGFYSCRFTPCLIKDKDLNDYL